MKPLQTPIAGVWAWEFAPWRCRLIEIGCHRQLEPSLRFYERQNVSAFTVPLQAGGDVKTTRGTYAGSTML